MLPCKDAALRQFPAAQCSGATRPTQRPAVLRRTAAVAPRTELQQPQAAPSLQQRLATLLTAAVVTTSLATAGPAVAREPFLSSTGGRGLLAEEEAQLLRLREETEGQVRKELARARLELEAEAEATSEGKLCATPFGVDVVGITEAIALVGAIVGGVSAKKRKEEVELLNEQLRKINLSLRQQARAGTIYAPGLTYVPPTARGGAGEGDQGGAAAAATAAVAVAPPAAPSAPADKMQLLSLDEDDSMEAQQCRQSLKDGKRFLKEENGGSAMVRFEKALMLAKCIGNRVQERRAMRGLAAAARITKQYRNAIANLERVLEISREIGDHLGDADAYGTIADCYTDLGEFEKAAYYYDKYISTMNSEGSVV